jgi:colanic acid/amylovoran biosynthesis glycosyltransferase
MRVAVFTSQFPGHVNTFFARDIRALLESGIDIDIFPIYPLKPELWRYVPDYLGEDVLPRSKIHHINFEQILRSEKLIPLDKYGIFLRDITAISVSASRFGVEPLVKSMYALGKGLVWAHQFPHSFDHVLAYWGNYAATCAYIFNRLIDRPVPFSMFLHAGTDLYRKQVFLRQKLLYADNIIVVCEFNRTFIRERYPDIFHSIAEKVHLHHLGLDLDEFPYEPEGRQVKKVLGVGGLVKHKGFDYLLRAARELTSRGIDIEVELVGDGKERDSLEALARKLEITDRLKFRGWLPSDQVRNIMKQAAILVHPSIGLGDAVPTVIKESMALGTPIVASNVAGIPELLDGGRCGMLVPPQNVEALANAIKTLLANTAMRRTYADAARKYAEEQFDLWRNGRRLARVLRSTKRIIEAVSSQEGVLHE